MDGYVVVWRRPIGDTHLSLHATFEEAEAAVQHWVNGTVLPDSCLTPDWLPVAGTDPGAILAFRNGRLVVSRMVEPDGRLGEAVSA
jgi:hypothetical protein